MRTRRGVATLVASALVAAGAAVLVTATATAAGAVTVGDAAQLHTAFGDGTVSRIDLTADISCDSRFVRNSDNPVTIDGHGHKIDGTGCNGAGVTGVGILLNGGGGLLTMVNVTVTNGLLNGTCSIGGAGIQTNGSLVLDHSAVTSNAAISANIGGPGCQPQGGGILTAGGASVTLISSTVASDSALCGTCASASGGGIQTTTLVATNSTISNNIAVGMSGIGIGGGVLANLVTLTYTTISDNAASSGANVNGAVTSFGSVVANPMGGGPNCSTGSHVSHGYNWEEATSTCGFTATGDHASALDPQLGAVAPNGGPTPTRLPAGGSGLVGAIPQAHCADDGAANVSTDQRDLLRPADALGACDIGAVEVQPAGTSGTFTSLPPKRILDTRDGTGLSGAFTPQQTRDLVVVGGTTTVPPTGVTAVVLNVTATAPSAAGWLTLFPKGASLPTASNLNFLAGQTVPNLVVVKVGTGGAVSINNTGGNPAAGTVHVVADVVGYYTDTTLPNGAGKFTGVAPSRILDTRSNIGLSGAFTPNQHRQLDVNSGGVTPIPATATAIVLNVTATAPSAPGWLTVSPLSDPFPNASNLNFLAGQTVPNLVVVKVPADGRIDIANTDVPVPPNPAHPASGTVHVIADLVGYYDTTESTVVAMAPQRILDTRFGTGGVTGPVAPNATITVDPRTATGLPPAGSYKAVIVNVTATGPTQAGWLTAYPSDATLPNASNLNFVAGQTVPNLVKVKVGADGTFKITNTDVPVPPNPSHPASGTVHVIVDIVGWFQ